MIHFNKAFILRVVNFCGFLTMAIFVPVERLKRSAIAILLSSFKLLIWDKNSKSKTVKLDRAKYIAFTLIFAASVGFAEIPVVDDSENYALLEEQTITAPSSVPNTSNENFYDGEQALAHDNNAEVAVHDDQDAYEKIKILKQDIQELRGQIEVLTHELTKLKEQQLTFYKDLDARIQNKSPVNLSENEKPRIPEPTKSDPTTQTPIQASGYEESKYVSISKPVKEHSPSSNTSPADEQISYLQAYELVKNKQLSEALTAMQKFISKYPSGYYSSNAQYWLGELYLAEKNYPDAISHFDEVLQKYPTSNKYSASLLKLGYALAGSGRYGEAKEKLREVMNKYPDTNTSELARNKLEEINSNI